MKWYKTIKDINTGIFSICKDMIFKKDDTGLYIHNDKSLYNYSFLDINDKSLFKEFEMPITSIEVGNYVERKGYPNKVYAVTNVYTKFMRGKPCIYVDINLITKKDPHYQSDLKNVPINYDTRRNSENRR